MKSFIIHKFQRTGTSWFGEEYYCYQQTLKKAFKSRKEAHKYIEGTIGAILENNRWRKVTPYNTYLYEIQQVTID